VQDLGKASSAEVATALAERETASPEKALDPHTVALLQEKMQNTPKSHLKVGGNV